MAATTTETETETTYVVSVANSFDATSPADAVQQMVAWLQDYAYGAGYRVTDDNGLNILYDAEDGTTFPHAAPTCDLHHGPWGSAPGCVRCTFTNGTPRPITEPAYLELDEFTHPG